MFDSMGIGRNNVFAMLTQLPSSPYQLAMDSVMPGQSCGLCPGRLSRAPLTVLHQEHLDPVMVTPLADPIRNRGGVGRHLEALAEGLAEPLQHRRGQAADGGVQLADRGWIEGRQAGIIRGLLGYRGWQL